MVLPEDKAVESSIFKRFDHKQKSLSQFWSLVRQELNSYHLEQVSLLISSVKDSTTRNLLESLPSWIAGSPFVAITDGSISSLKIAYQEAENLGVDRWLAMNACLSLAKHGCVVVDAGTAITLDLLPNNSEHIGGFIVPGLSKQREALLGSTEKVWTNKARAPKMVLGTNTDECVENGIFAQISNFIVTQAMRFDVDNLVFTGGDGFLLYSNIRPILESKNLTVQFRPNLVFEGLLAIYKKYHKKMQ